MSARLVEFSTDPDQDYGTGVRVLTWQNVISIDLQWVASANPYDWDATWITLAGSAAGLAINVAYSDFMTMWRVA